MVPKRKLGVLGDVSAMGLGCMGLTWAYASALEGTLEEKEAFVRAAHDRGVTLFNSANIYTGGPHGHNEVRTSCDQGPMQGQQLTRRGALPAQLFPRAPRLPVA